MNNQKEGNHLLHKLQKNLEWMVLFTLLAVVVSSIYTFFLVTPIYESTSEVLTTNSTSESIEQRQNNATYTSIAQSDWVLEPVIETLALDTTPASLRENVQVEEMEMSNILAIHAQNENPYVAAEITNAVAETFVEVVQDEFPEEEVQILSRAVAVTTPAYPNHVTHIGLGALVGLIIGLFVVLIRKQPENVITDPNKVEEVTNFQSLGNISTFTEDDLLILNVRSKDNSEQEFESEPEEEVLSRKNRHRF